MHLRNGRARAGVLLLLLLGVCVSAGRQLAQVAVTATPEERAPEVVADYDEHRFPGLADALPPGGVVGYVTSTKHNDNPDRSHALAQFALAPCLVVLGEEPSFVLVDLGPDEEIPASLAGRPVPRRLDNGVRLVGREERP
jgi:hypothetical protein